MSEFPRCHTTTSMLVTSSSIQKCLWPGLFEYRIYVSRLSQIMKEVILSEIGDMIHVIQTKATQKRVVIVINNIFLFNMN